MDRADRQKLIMLVLLTILFAYFGWYGVGAFKGVSGLRQEAAKLKTERDQLQTEVQNAQVMVANLDRIRKEREALELQLRELSRRLPTEAESAQVLRSLETQARKAGLTVGAVKRRPSRPQELYVEVPMEVSFSGGYQQLRSFAEEVSKLPRLATLNELTVRTFTPTTTGGKVPEPATESTDSVNAQMVTVVYQARPETLGGPAPVKP
jgi:type IV pilus assembly protein PilO